MYKPLRSTKFQKGQLLNPQTPYVPAAQQSIEHLREVIERERVRIEIEKANEAERVAKVRRLTKS